ncbi:MAG: ribonuclease Z [Chitinophagaceae bacterium]
MTLTILGNNSALPAFGRHPTAQYLEHQNHAYLIDCGEGTQMQLQLYKKKRGAIHYIFISHIHGDHYLGLVGLLSSFALLGRTQDLYIFCPKEIKNYIEVQLTWDLGYTIHYDFLDTQEERILVDNKTMQVKCFPVSHSVPTHGFLFVEKKKKRKLVPQKIQSFEIPKYFYNQLSEGADYIKKDGTIIKNSELTTEGSKPRIYAYAADTCYDEKIIEYVQHAHVLYHETTYMQADIEKAKLRMHSTTEQAATLALKAQVDTLLIGHFSSKYKKLEPLLEECKSVFENTQLAIEGFEITI